MVTQINTKPNTFYAKKPLDDDVGVLPVYGDAYIGLTSTFDIVSSPNSSYYLGESTVITENDFVYGDGVLSECYLDLYANSLSQLHPQTQPWMDVYGLISNTDLVEGNLSIDTTVGDLSIYSSIYDMESPWVVEDFDGTNKFFINKPSRFMPGFYLAQGDFLEINSQDYIDAVLSTHEGSTDEHSGWTWNNLVEETTQAVDWGESKVLEFSNWSVQGLYEAWNFLADPAENLKLDTSGVLGWPDAINLQKHTDGLYYYALPGSKRITNLTAAQKTAFLNLLMEGHTRKWWVARGAREFSHGGRTNSAEQYSNFDETYVTHCDQFNSIFSTVYRRGMARDVKAETTGDAGDNTNFLAYVNADIVTDDIATDGNALQMKLFWENYVGDLSGDNNINNANFFGYGSVDNGAVGSDPSGSKHPLTQLIFGSIENMPAPAMYDITTPTLVPSVAPEIEIIFKINRMDTLPYCISGANSTNSNYDTDRGREISRSFSIMFSHYAISSGTTSAWGSSDPLISENLPDNGPNADLSVGGGGNMVINFCKIGQSNNIDVVGYWNSTGDTYAPGNIIGYRSYNGDGYYGLIYKRVPGSEAWTDAGYDPYHTQIPEGEWVKMRIKLGRNMLTSGAIVDDKTPWATDTSSDTIAYFPDIKDENGKMKKIQVFSPFPMGPNSGIWPTTFTVWANNMRSINEVPGELDTDNANNGYTKIDDVPNDDKMVDVLIDKISFHGWGSLTNNASVTLENGTGKLLKLPNVKGIPVAPVNDKISVVSNVSGSDNYYGQYTHPIASYLSLGYDSSGTADVGVQNHQLLLNDFFTVNPSTVQQIPYMRAGYFTSGNYEESEDWFQNMSIGGAATDMIRVGGPSNYVDGFVSKGLMRVSSSFDGWVKTGNPYVAAKILTISADGTEITVDKPEIFNTDTDQRFVVEKIGAVDGFVGPPPTWSGMTYPQYLVGSGSKGYVGALTQTKPSVGNAIYLNDSILFDDQGMKLGQQGGTYTTFAEWNSQCRLRVSPYKYWVNIAVANVADARPSSAGGVGTIGNLIPGATYIPDPGHGQHNFPMEGGTGSDCVISAMVSGDPGLGVSVSPRSNAYVVDPGSGYTVGDTLVFPSDDKTIDATIDVESVIDVSDDGWGSWYDYVSGGSATPLAPRSYDTVVPVSGGSVRGTTFNETVYNDGVYSNLWNLNFMDFDSNFVVNNVNYGYGVINQPSGDEEVSTVDLSRGKGGGYISREFLVSGQNYINLNNYVRVSQPKFGDDFNFMVVPSYMMTQGSSYAANIDTADGPNKAQLIYGIKDLPPKIANFTVSPAVDFLKQGADIYNITKGKATDIKFEWEEEGDDVWYRMLWIDTENINTKYHGATFIAPLNEPGTTAYYYTSSADYETETAQTLVGVSSSATLWGDSINIPDIEGVRGYGTKLSGATLLSSSTTEYLGSNKNFTHCFYLRPTTSGTFFCASGSDDGGGEATDCIWQYSISSSKVRMDVGASGSTLTTLTSLTSYDLNGIQPIAIVFTYDADLDNNNFKLYVNGHLEDTSDYSDGINYFAYRIGIGSHIDGSHPYSGFVQEITLHSKTASVPTNPNSYIQNTKHLRDVELGKGDNFYNGRLFVFDYHNINGLGRTDVGRSNQAGWKVTSV